MAISDRSSQSVILFTEDGNPIYPAGPVYAAAAVNITMSTSPTDVLTITGSSTKTVKVQRVVFTANQTTGAARDVMLIKRSTSNSGGTSVTLTKVPLDSNSAAATAVCKSYTANPTLGSTVGTVRSRKTYVGTLTGSGSNSDEFIVEFMVPLVLRGTGESLCVNLNGVSTSGGVFTGSFEWSEE
jgi:hypothetical protein